MEQAGEPEQQEQPPTPLKCPRCNSLDTKFRYFNNHSLTQPRHYCKTCKRLWTAGGNLRNIPLGGKTRSGKQTKASSSRCGSRIAAIFHQDFDRTMIQSATKPPTCHFNDEISFLDAIQSLIHPEVINQHVNAGNQSSSGGANMEIAQEWNNQSMVSSQQAFPQQISEQIKSHHTYNQANSGTPFLLHNNSLVQPTWPMNSLHIPNNSGVSTSNASLWNDFGGNTTDTEMDTTSVNIDEWLNFSDDDSQ